MTTLEWKVAKALRRMQRRKERNMAVRFATKAVMVGMLAGAAVLLAGAAGYNDNSITVEHTVKPGETLWTIAENHCGDTYIMEYIDMLKKSNPELIKSKGQVQAGQILRLEYRK